MNQYRCETCKHLEKDFVDWGFDPYCHGFGNHIQGAKISLEIWEWIKRYGCASHSDFQSERDMVLDKLCKICPFLDKRPETCENCVVETVRKELRKAGE
jgi:hypothetical protein